MSGAETRGSEFIRCPQVDASSTLTSTGRQRRDSGLTDLTWKFKKESWKNSLDKPGRAWTCEFVYSCINLMCFFVFSGAVVQSQTACDPLTDALRANLHLFSHQNKAKSSRSNITEILFCRLRLLSRIFLTGPECTIRQLGVNEVM